MNLCPCPRSFSLHYCERWFLFPLPCTLSQQLLVHHHEVTNKALVLLTTLFTTLRDLQSTNQQNEFYRSSGVVSYLPICAWNLMKNILFKKTCIIVLSVKIVVNTHCRLNCLHNKTKYYVDSFIYNSKETMFWTSLISWSVPLDFPKLPYSNMTYLNPKPI